MSGFAWDDQRAFLAVLEEGSFSAAARRLGIAQPTVRARVEALQHALGTVLFKRSVNGLVPTEEARALGGPARSMALCAIWSGRRTPPRMRAGMPNGSIGSAASPSSTC